MRFLFAAAVAVLTLAPVRGGLTETASRPAPPKISETQDADKKAEFLEARPYKPCPANVRFPSGQQVCLGFPGYPDSKVRTDDPNE
jgi:hypothetical protein